MNRNAKRKSLPFIVLLIACAITIILIALGDEELPPAPSGELLSVEVVAVEKTDYRLQIPAWGFVEPRERIDIRAEAAGRVTQVAEAVMVGGRVKRGEMLFSTDRRDYVNRLEEAQAVHEQTKQALAIEKGLQTVAKTEWATLELDGDADPEEASLALREPHLKDRQAAIRIAAAREAQAALDLERTVVRSPSDGVILSENVGVGQYLASHEVALHLACGANHRIRAWFSPEHSVAAGASVSVRIDGKRYEGTIRTVLPQVDPETRQKQALVELATDAVPLGAYAELTLPGSVFRDVVTIPVQALRPDATAWVLDEKGALVVRHLKVVARDARTVVVSGGLEAGCRVILSHIAQPLEGMPLVAVGSVETVNRDGE